jgi:glutaredoxin-like protein
MKRASEASRQESREAAKNMTDQMLNKDIQKQVSEIFADLHHPIRVLFFGSQDQQCEYCQETHQLLEEVASLSDLIALESWDIDEDKDLAAQYRVERVPAFVITGEKDGQPVDYGIRYYGIPAGHEFTSLVNDLIMVSKGDSGLAPETRAFLADLKKPVHLQVFVTPTCPYCPRAVVLAHQFAMESDQVEAEMVEAMEFPDLSNQYNVSGVPHTSINFGAGELIGSAPEAHLLSEIRLALENAKS